MYFGGKTGTNIFSVIINGLKGLVAAETGAITATGAFTVAWKTMVGAVSGFAIGAIIAGISYVADKLITTNSELKEIAQTSHDALVSLKNNANELEKTGDKLDSVAKDYSKIATTVGDVNERKTALTEIQQDLVDTYGEEAKGIDLVNGKYSEQIKKLEELKAKEEEKFRRENAGNIAEARTLSKMRFDEKNLVLSNGKVSWLRDESDAQQAQFEVGKTIGVTSKKDYEALSKVADKINGVYKGVGQSIYLTGNLEEARDKLSLFVDEYGKLKDVNQTILQEYSEHLKMLNEEVSLMKEMQPYIENSTSKHSGWFGDIVNSNLETQTYDALDKVFWQPFYSKLDEAQEKLKQLANPSDLSISEYDTLYRDVQNLEHELYKMSEYSESAKQIVTDLFNGFKQGISENGDHLEQFVEQFNTTLEDSFKKIAETVTGVQDAINKLAEGKGLSHSEAWKLLKEDTDGYLQSIKLVNGEYYLSQEELIKFKDAKIKASVDELKASNEQYTQERENLLKQLDLQKEELKLAKAQFELDVLRGKINSQSDYEYMRKAVTDAEIAISETEKSIKRCNDLWTRNNYLIEELNQNLGDTRVLSLATETELNNAIKSFENEIKSIEDSVDVLNDRKDALESEKDLLQDQLDILNEQKEAIEDTIKKYDAVADAVSGYAKAQTDAIQEQIDAMEEAAESIKKDYDDQISELEEQNEERDDALKKEKALADLQNAQNQKKRVFSAERGWEYQSSKEDILTAQKELADIETEQRIKSLEKERDTKLAEIDNHKEVYELQIKAYEDYAKKYSDISSNIKQTENELLADQILGADWREKITEEAQSSIETLFGNWGTFGGLDIAFTPVLKTSNSTEVLNSQTISDYINAIVQKAGGDLSAANILKLDSTGLDIGGKTIKNIIADVGATAEQTSKIIRYIGKDGVYNLVSKQIGNVTSTLDIGIDKVHETNEALLGNTEMLSKFESEYKEYNNQLNNLINNEIKNLQDSIDMKQAEIDKIDDEIKAYNKYKSSVQNSLNEAKDTLEEYQKTVETAKTNVINQFDTMAEGVYQAQDKIYQNCNNIKRWFGEVGDSAKELENTLRNHLLSGDFNLATYVQMMKATMGSFANGGQIDYTGLAMVHGSKSNPETVFNAADSKKLYDLVHNTPNLIDSIVKRAGQISSFTPTTINNRNDTNSSNISVNIGQVVANNPQELTRNLDTHLDSYFRRKLTMGYVQ